MKQQVGQKTKIKGPDKEGLAKIMGQLGNDFNVDQI